MAIKPSVTNGHVEANALWRPSSPEKTQIHEFKVRVSQKYNLKLNGYQDLWQWSVDEPAKFWEEVWKYTGVKAQEPYSNVSIPRYCLRLATEGRSSRYWLRMFRCSHDHISSKEVASTLPKIFCSQQTALAMMQSQLLPLQKPIESLSRGGSCANEFASVPTP